MGEPLKKYLDAINELTQRIDASEQSYYSALETLLEALAQG